MEDKDVIKAVQSLRPVVYEWKDKEMIGQSFGFIAQELEEIFPMGEYDIITEDTNGMKMVGYHQIIPLLVKYIQNLEERVSKLESVEDKNEL